MVKNIIIPSKKKTIVNNKPSGNQTMLAIMPPIFLTEDTLSFPLSSASLITSLPKGNALNFANWNNDLAIG